jgi:CHAT domain-containing protein
VDAVQGLRRAIEEQNGARWQAMSRALYARLVQPLDAAIAGKSLVIVPHGVLHYLPFHALQNSEGQFLIDQHAVRFVPSASVLSLIRPSTAKSGPNLLAIGNPDLGNPKLDLEYSETEVRGLAGMYGDSRVLLRRDATESAFKKAGGVFQRIHFATHGMFKAESPLESGLYLAKDADNDGALTVGELYSLSLTADLVTLSACETGLGKISNGDDVVGLARGFLYAGARSIVSSLWSVDDKATSELMQAFYRNLASMPKHEALRQAQIQARKDFAHPFYWAAFQLTGKDD